MNGFKDLVGFIWELVFLTGLLTLGLILFGVALFLLLSTIRAFYYTITASGRDE